MLRAEKKLYAIALILFFLCSYVVAIEYDPAQFVTKQTYMLRENETIGNVKEIELDGKAYYVVQITTNKDVTGYIALERFEKKVVSEQVKSKQLFQTMHFWDLYLKFKKRVSDNPSYIWFILQHEQISTIKQALETEKYELALISQVINTEEVVDKVANLVSMLDSIITDLDELRSAMLDAISFESDFLNAPKAGQETELKEKLLACYEKLEAVFRKKQDYEALLVQLRIDIANDPNLSIEEKKSLQKTSELPEEAHTIDTWYSSATNMHFKENIENAYLSALQNSSKFASNVAMRIKRDACYKFIYEENEKLEKETKNELMTLKTAYDVIMDEKYYEKWLNREQLKEFKTNWAKAISSLEKEDYDNALRYAKKALNNAIAVYKDGFFQQDGTSNINDVLLKALVAIAFILIGILIIKYIMKRKGQLFGISGGDYEEVEFKNV
jgi:hypothetical protein